MARTPIHHRSKEITDKSDARDARQGVFRFKSPKRIAASLKDSAEHSERPKADAYRSAMSTLTQYISRAGAQLQPAEKQRLEEAKEELRNLFHRPLTGRTTVLGRRVEKPGTGRQSGPSGQRDDAKHDRTHANK